MRARLLALAAFLAAAVGGGIYFVDWDAGTVSRVTDLPGGFEAYDRTRCTVAACNATACNQARSILADAGSADTIHLVECPVRLGARSRAILADGGVTFDGGLYQQVRFIAQRDPATGAIGIPVDVNGLPQFALGAGTPGCKKRPTGTAVAQCQRLDAGDQGDENQADSAELTGAGCVAVTCGCIAGDAPP